MESFEVFKRIFLIQLHSGSVRCRGCHRDDRLSAPRAKSAEGPIFVFLKNVFLFVLHILLKFFVLMISFTPKENFELEAASFSRRVQKGEENLEEEEVEDVKELQSEKKCKGCGAHFHCKVCWLVPRISYR